MSVIILLSAIFNFFLAIFVFLKSKNKTQKTFGALTIIIVIWLVLNYLYFKNPQYPFIQLTYGFGAVVIAAIFYWISVYTKTHISKIYVYLISITTTFLFIVSLIPNYLIKSGLEPVAYGYYSEKGSWFSIYGVIETIILFSASVILIRFFKKTEGLQRLQATHVIAGFIIPIALVILLDFVLPIFQLYWFDSFDNLTSLLFVGFISYAITRYRLFDIGIVIKRGAIKVISFAIIFGGYLFLVLSLKDSLDLNSQSEQTTFLVIATLVVVVTIEPIRKLVHRIVDKAFESNEQKREEAQKKIRLTLRSQQSVENLFISMSKIMQDLFNSEKSLFIEKSDSFFKNNKETFQYLKTTGKILIPEELPYRFEEEERYFFIHQELEKTDYSSLIPLGQDDIFMGCIVLGKRKNHDAYTVEEVREMKQLQEQFAEALWNARLYQQAIARIKI